MTIRDTKPPNPERPQPRFAPGPLGRGVYLADLVRWLMEKHQATRVHVVKEYLCPVMLAQHPQWGWTEESGEVKGLPAIEWYRSVKGSRQWTGGRLVTQYGRTISDTRQYSDSLGKGLSGAVQWLLTYWACDRNADAVMYLPGSLATKLAVTEADARRCWGWRGADEAQPAVDAVGKPADATNDEWWLAWCAKRNTANTLPDGKAKRGRARVGWEDADLQVLGLRLKTLMGQGLADSAAKTSMASSLEMTTQALEKQLEKLGTSRAVANNQATQKVN